MFLLQSQKVDIGFFFHIVNNTNDNIDRQLFLLNFIWNTYVGTHQNLYIFDYDSIYNTFIDAIT